MLNSVTIVTLAALCASLAGARRLGDQIDNEINRNPNDIDFGKTSRDWVRISQSPSPVVQKQAGANIELECEAVGSPAPTMQWLKGNRPLTDNESFESNIINDNPTRGLAKVRTRLVIYSALPMQKGTFTCLAESGSQVATATSEVFVSRNEISERNYTEIMAEKLLNRRAAPRIVLYDTIYMDNIGSDIVLPCKAIGSPLPSVIWLDPSEQIIANDPRLTVLPDGELRIRNIRWNDMGPYTCVARSAMGQDNITTFLYPMLAEK